MRLLCVPQGFCTWNYRVLDDAQAPPRQIALLRHGRWRENGAIEQGAMELAIRRSGFFSTSWSLEADGMTMGTAAKTSFFARRLAVEVQGRHFELRPSSFFRRDYAIWADGDQVGIIRRVHAFTRRAVVEAEEMPLVAALFCAWLVTLMWRRQTEKSS